MAVCEDCRTHQATKSSPTGRPLCATCFAQFVGHAAGGTAISGGGGSAEAIVTGIAAAGSADVMDGEGEHQRRQKDKLARTEGFFKRLWVRVVG